MSSKGRRTTDEWWGNPYELLTTGVAGVAAAAILFTDRLPGTLNQYFAGPTTKLWAIVLVVGGVLVLTGLFNGSDVLTRLALRRTGLYTAGTASALYAPVLAYAGNRGAAWPAVQIFLLAVAGLWKAWLLGREADRIEKNMIELDRMTHVNAMKDDDDDRSG